MLWAPRLARELQPPAAPTILSNNIQAAGRSMTNKHSFISINPKNEMQEKKQWNGILIFKSLIISPCFMYLNISGTCDASYQLPVFSSVRVKPETWSQSACWRVLLPACESCRRGPVWVQAAAAGAGCSHTSGRRHAIRTRRDVGPLAPPPPPAAAGSDISDWSSLMWEIDGGRSN